MPASVPQQLALPPILLAIARWSRYVSAAVPCAATNELAQFVAWLCEFGEPRPGRVLSAPSNDVAFIIAADHEPLSRVFRLFSSQLALLGDGGASAAVTKALATGRRSERVAGIAPKVCELRQDAEEDLLAFYLLPREHWTKLRSTNPLERINKESAAAPTSP